MVERDLLDTKCPHGSRAIPSRQWFGRVIVALRLRQNEPVPLQDEPSKGDVLRFAALLLDCSLDRDRHPQREGLLSLLHIPLAFLPLVERGDWAGGDPAFGTLNQRQDLVADAVSVKREVSLVD